MLGKPKKTPREKMLAKKAKAKELRQKKAAAIQQEKAKRKKTRKESSLTKSDRNSILLAVVALIPLFYLLLIYRPSDQTNNRVIGKLVTKQTLKRRHSRSLYWGPLDEGEPVYLRDIVYTPREVTATFILTGGQLIQIEPDSMVQFDEVTLDTINITLYGGSVRGFGINLNDRDPLKLKPYQVGKLLPYLPDVEPLEFRSEEFTARLQKRLRRRLPLRKTKDIQQPELPLNTVEYYAIDLLRPTQNQVVQLKRGAWVDTLWTPIPLGGVRYEINISKGKTFEQSITHETDVNGLELSFRDESIYYWQVRGFVGDRVVLSQVRRFIMSKQGVPMFNRLPTGDMKIEGYIQEIAKDKSFKKMVSSIVAQSKECSKLTLRKGKYWCRIWNIDRSKRLRLYRMKVK